MTGIFISLDGPGGAGKSTLVSLIAERLIANGGPALATRQPSDSPLGVLARHRTDTYGSHALACLVAADRYHHLATVIRPALESGQSVVCDRYVPSSYVLQQRDGVPLTFIRALNAEADRPHLAVLLTADPDLLERRLRVRGGHSRFEHDGSSHAEARLYAELADVLQEDGFPPLVIDTGDISPQQAAATIADHASSLSSRR